MYYTAVEQFQFQIGAIKSSMYVTSKVYINQFQFQIGAIKRTGTVLNSLTTRVSIPDWCD